ncbi:hypothetical protein TrVE_jg5467 [Triparma verrucosa]|uniref:CDP-alcohol phosphatidyltransferase n=2 Tax=Triparma TaxID=722752 RepID=A0A9W6ZW58_9STRA|nr:hypothetical protein TrST_g11503 [Triparma strigata]GMH83906.1 hypothetical protein TrVE_jg5467 [Triparma verrucosa]
MPASTRSRSTSRGRSPAKKSPASGKSKASTPKKSPASKSPSRSTRSKSKTPTKKAPASKATKKEYKTKYPPILNCTPDGYTPSPLISNMILCSGNLDYFFADLLVPPLYAVGLNTPNKITIFNCVVRLYLIAGALWTSQNYALTALLLVSQQVLDCADGQCARRYGLGSEFGAWLDHITDEIFGYAYAATFIYMIYGRNGAWSVPMYVIVTVLAIMGVGGKSTFEAKDTNIKFKDFKWNHVLGMYQEFYMTYIYLVMMSLYVFMGWLPGTVSVFV